MSIIQIYFSNPSFLSNGFIIASAAISMLLILVLLFSFAFNASLNSIVFLSIVDFSSSTSLIRLEFLCSDFDFRCDFTSSLLTILMSSSIVITVYFGVILTVIDPFSWSMSRKLWSARLDMRSLFIKLEKVETTCPGR